MVEGGGGQGQLKLGKMAVLLAAQIGAVCTFPILRPERESHPLALQGLGAVQPPVAPQPAVSGD